MSLDSKRKYVVVCDPDTLGFHPSGFERKNIALQMWPTSVSLTLGLALLPRTSAGLNLAATRPVDSALSGATHISDRGLASIIRDKEFSCRKNW